MNERTLAIVLVALRNLQNAMHRYTGWDIVDSFPDYFDEGTTAVTVDEIDQICMSLNMDRILKKERA